MTNGNMVGGHNPPKYTYNGLSDEKLGLTFPTTMKAIADAMEPDTAVVFSSSQVQSGGATEITDWGLTVNGTGVIFKGYNVHRISMLCTYSTTSATYTRLYVGGYAYTDNATHWAVVYDDTQTIPIVNGGTGATTAAEALSNLGGLGYTNVTTAGTNLDNYTAFGIYYFSGDYTPTNIPVGSNGWLLVLPYSSTICKQIWFRHGATDSNDFNTFVRTNSGGTWSSWTQLLTSKNCTTEANIISKKSAPELQLQATGTSNPAFYMMRDADSTEGTTNDWRMYCNASGTLAIQYRAGDSGSWTKGLYLTSNGGLVVSASNYGSTLPSSGTTGQVFFKI